MNAPVIHLPLLVALGIFPVPFHVTKTDWQKLVLKSKSETAGIKLPCSCLTAYVLLKPYLKSECITVVG
jgi:hypothetical protein